jgi:hypothetical protein
METVDLYRYEMTRRLGTGADYEVWAALERQTGKPVVLKRPLPQTVRHQLHAGIEARTDRLLQAYEAVGHTIPTVVPIVGYTERANHDAYFGDTLGQAYRVIVAEHATGIPLVGPPMARITGIPIGVSQNLFALFPLVQVANVSPFGIQQQLLDLEEAFYRAGYLLLDLRPCNVFYQPAGGRIAVIDCSTLANIANAVDRQGRPTPDVHDFYLEMLKFYTTPQPPPAQASGYREPYGLRPVVDFGHELDRLAQQFRAVSDAEVREAALTMISQVRQRAYVVFADFRRDLMAYLESVQRAHQALPALAAARQVWAEALNWLYADYWQQYLFRPEIELAAWRRAIAS